MYSIKNYVSTLVKYTVNQENSIVMNCQASNEQL